MQGPIPWKPYDHKIVESVQRSKPFGGSVPNPFGGSVVPTSDETKDMRQLPLEGPGGLPPPKPVMPEWLQTLFMQRIIDSLKAGKYVTAESIARNIVMMSKEVNVGFDLLHTAQYAVTVLKSMNYTEENFLSSMNAYMEQKGECPVDAVKPDPKTGQCPDEYIPFIVKGKTCCQRISKMLNKADQNAAKMRGEIFQQPTEDDLADMEAFDRRYLIGKQYEKDRKDVRYTLTSNVPQHTQEFLQHIEKKDIEETTKAIKQELSKPDGGIAHEIAGFKDRGLFTRILNYFLKKGQQVGDFVEWVILSDWTRLWYFAVLVKVLLFFVCAYAKADQSVWSVMCEQWLGFKPLTFFFVGTWGPILMASLLFQMLFRMVSGAKDSLLQAVPGSNMLALITNPLSYVFDFIQLGYLAHRLSVLLSFPSFVYDLGTSIMDLFNAVKVGFQTYGSAMPGPLPSGVSGNLTTAWNTGLSTLCNSQFDMFLRHIGKGVRWFTKTLLIFLCEGLAVLIPIEALKSYATAPCKMFVSLIDQYDEHADKVTAGMTYNSLTGFDIASVFSNPETVAKALVVYTPKGKGK